MTDGALLGLSGSRPLPAYFTEEGGRGGIWGVGGGGGLRGGVEGRGRGGGGGGVGDKGSLVSLIWPHASYYA